MPPKTRGRGRGRGAPPGPNEDAPLPTVGRTLPPQAPPVQEVRQPAAPAPQPAKKAQEKTVSPEEVGIELQHKLALTSPLPRCPGPGKLGRPINLITNNYPIELPTGNVYHYDVEIISKGRVTEQAAGTTLPIAADKKYRCMNTRRNREVVCQLIAESNALRGFYPAYDGRKNLYTRRPLNFPGKSLKLTVEMHDEISSKAKGDGPKTDKPKGKGDGPRVDVFEVVIQPVSKKETGTCAINLDQLHAYFNGKIATAPQDVFMAMETVLRNGPCLRLTPVGRSFFSPPDPNNLHPLGGGRELWFGYHQSMRLGQWKPMVNIDLTATTFYHHGEVIKYVCEIFNYSTDGLKRTPMLKDAEIVQLTKELKGLWIEVTHLSYPRKYKVLRVTRESASKLEFIITVDGKNVKTRVYDYFLKQYRRKLEFPNLPCLQVGPEAKKIYLPMEICKIKEGQHCKKKLDERQNAEMIKFTAVRPKERFDKIRKIVDDANFNQDPYVKEFGFKVVCEPLKLQGRILHPPNVRYSREKKLLPKDGSWDMRNVQFLKGAVVQKWAMISFASDRFCGRQQLQKFASMLSDIGRSSGIEIGPAEMIEIFDSRRDKVDAILEKLKVKFNVDLVVIVIPSRNKEIYADAKQAAETILGLATQCVKDSNVVKNCNPPLVSNLCQKINAKMGGVNNGLLSGETPAILKRPVIIIGADVTHPSPSNDIKPSIAAAVGSLDAHPSRYAVTCRAQTNVDQQKKSIEIILDLKEMVKDLLKAFYRNTNGKKPEKIIFFRDGVSEGQFEKVRDHEVKCIRDACRSLSEEYQPGITFVVVQKRHHTRFMPADPRDGCGRPGNVPPGTTIDTMVTHPMNFDFFQCSHFGLQGTSKPGHYTVIEDDNNFTPDDLHKLTYYLCHTYVRCTKSISVPAPVQYAHLAAFRARQHYLTQIGESSASSDISAAFQPLPQNIKDSIKVLDCMNSTMYFV